MTKEKKDEIKQSSENKDRIEGKTLQKENESKNGHYNLPPLEN